MKFVKKLLPRKGRGLSYGVSLPWIRASCP